ncbi:MAG: thioredoxin family protein [Gemmatimonadota bacterium]
MTRTLKLPFLFGVALLAATVSATGLEAQAATAHSKEDFTQERFAQLQAEGAFILVDIFADWCPDCAIQQRVLTEYREQHPDVPLHTLVVNFDTQKDIVTQFRAPRQSTLILFRGTEQLWFSVAETRAEVLVQALNEGYAGR